MNFRINQQTTKKENQTMITSLKQPTTKRPTFSVTTAGPRQSKQTSDALTKLLRAGMGTIVMDNWGESVQWTMCSETPDETVHRGLREAAYLKIHEKHEGMITKENFKAIIADVQAEIPALLAAQPRRDNRKSKEVIDAERKRQIEAEAVMEAKRKEQAVKDAIVQEQLLVKYPHLTRLTNDISRHALAAVNIRKELKEAFPTIQFTVTTSSFSGGNDCRVGWDEGPTSKQVEAITNKYKTGEFDSMEDIYRYSSSVFNSLFGGVKYLFCERSIPEARKQQVIALLEPKLGYSYGAAGSWERSEQIRRMTWELFARTDLTGKGTIKAIDCPESVWELTFN
jgi:hypothetical protein